MPEAYPDSFFGGLSWDMVASSPQDNEKYGLFSGFLIGGIHDYGILLAIPLEFQEIKHQPFPMTQPF